MKKQKEPLVPEAVQAEASNPQTPPARLEEIYYRYPTKLAEVIAKNPSTPPELLENLSQIKALQGIIAQNPNTPSKKLRQLWVKHPGALLENPALPLWLLESPSFWASLPSDVQVPFVLLPQLSPDLLRVMWQQTAFSSTQAEILKNPNTPLDVIEAASHIPAVAGFVARRRDLTDEIFLTLLGSDNYVTRSLVEQNPTHPKALLTLCKQLGWDASWQPTKSVINQHISEGELSLLVGGGPYLRLLLARYPGTPNEILAQLASSKHKEVLQEIAKHPNSSEALLRQIIKENAEFIAHLIARRPDFSLRLGQDILRYKNSSTSFQLALAEMARNPNTPLPLLLRLLREHGAHCYQQLLAREPMPRALLRAALGSVRYFIQGAIALRQDLLPEDLHVLSGSPKVDVRILVAKHPNTLIKTKERLAYDEHPAVREAVEGVPRLEPYQLLARVQQKIALLSKNVAEEPAWLFDELLSSLSLEQRQDLASHPIAPAALARWFLQHHPKESLIKQSRKESSTSRAEALQILASKSLQPYQVEALVTHRDPLVRRAIARHPMAPSLFLLSVIFGGNVGEQMAMAKNPNLPEAIKRWVEQNPRLKSTPP